MKNRLLLALPFIGLSLIAGEVAIGNYYSAAYLPTHLPKQKRGVEVVEALNPPPGNGDCCTTSPEIVKQMDELAKQRHLRWSVFCTGLADQGATRFIGVADSNPVGVSYIEDGAVPSWVFSYGSTQQEAVFALMRNLKNAPNKEPMSRMSSRRKNQCEAPPIGSDHLRIKGNSFERPAKK